MKITSKEKRILIVLISIIILLIVITKSIAYYNWYNDPFRPFSDNEKTQIESQKSPEPIKIAGTYVWEGTRSISFYYNYKQMSQDVDGRDVIEIFEDGNCTENWTSTNSAYENNKNYRWYIDNEKSKIVFGVFKDQNPNDQSPGAMFSGIISNEGIKMTSGSFYKKIK